MMRILTLLALLATPAAAQDRLSILMGSTHAGAGPAAVFDGRTPGLILTWEDRGPGLDLHLAAYRNSFGRGSLAVMAGRPLVRRGRTSLDLIAGLAWYPGASRRFALAAGDVVPLAGLQLRHGTLFVLALPGDGHSSTATVAAGLTFAIGDR